MTRLRYEELRAGGPVITAEDEKRLRNFVPRKSALWVWVAIVMMGIR